MSIFQRIAVVWDRSCVAALRCVVVASLVLVCVPVGAEEPASVPLTNVIPRVGWKNVCKVGLWTEVALRFDDEGIESGSKFDLVLTASDPQGHLAHFRQSVQAISRGDDLEVSGLVKVGSLDSPIMVKVLSNGETVWQKRLRPGVDFELLKQETPLLVIYGASEGFDFTTEAIARRLIHQPRVVELESLDDFSLNPLSYEIIHALVCADHFELSEGVNAAIREWTSEGGHFVVATGSNVEAFQKSPLAEWIAVRVGEIARLRELSGFEGFVGRTVPIRVFEPVPSPKLEIEQGIVLVRELEGPLAVRVPYGFGRVTFLGVSIHEPPVSNWEPLALAMVKLAGLETVSAAPVLTVQGGSTGRLGQSGISDLKTQLQMATQADLQPLQMNVWTIIILGFLFALVVGPIDYALCRYVLKSPSLTWLTLPVWLIAGGLLIAQWNQSRSFDQLRIGKISLVDLNVVSGDTRERTWVSWISPITKRYDLKLPDGCDAIGWSGEPENAFGGMYRGRTVQLNKADYDVFVKESKATGIPALTASVNTWECQGSSSLKDLPWNKSGEGLIEADLNASALGQVTGTFRHHLPHEIKDWILIYGPRVYSPKDATTNQIPVGTKMTLDNTTMSQSELGAFLRRQSSRKVKVDGRVGEDVVLEEESYDPLSRDLMRLVRVISIYSNFRGWDYTRMNNAELSGDDLSSIVELEQAVLIAETTGLSNGPMELDGKAVEASERTFVRIVLPVKRVSRGLQQLPLKSDEIKATGLSPERQFTGEDESKPDPPVTE